LIYQILKPFLKFMDILMFNFADYINLLI